MSRVVIVGASVGGLLSAAAVRQHVDEVVVLERRARPEWGTSLAPQGVLPHVLLAGGVEAVEMLVPGANARLHSAGAVSARAHEGLWWSGGIRAHYHDPRTVPLASRGLLESVLRSEVEAMPGVDVRYGSAVEGLRLSGPRVAGVRLGLETIDSDLVIDATGRGSRFSAWLGDDFEVPVEELRVDVGYVGLTFPDRGTMREKFLVCQAMFPHQPRIGLAMKTEGSRWSLVLGGYHGDVPPTDLAGVRAFVETLPLGRLGELIRSVDGFDSAHHVRFVANRRRRYEHRPPPPGLLAMGDAVCSFNPVYGQGMTVAAQQAVALRAAIRRDGVAGLDNAKLMRRFGRIIDGPWLIAAGGDRTHPATAGHRRGVDGWVDRVLHATAHDPVVARAMDRVTGLLDPPSTLFRPRVAWRVLTSRGARLPAPAEPVLVSDSRGERP